MPEMPAGCEEGIIRGMYKLSSVDADGQHRVQLFGSGAILREALRAQKILAEKYRDRERRVERHQLHAAAARRAGVRAVEHAQPEAAGAGQLRRAAIDRRRRARASRRATTCGRWPSRSAPGCRAACSRWAPTAWAAAKAAATLRRHFEVDAECITLAALYQLKKQGKCDGECVASAVEELGIDPEKQSALYA